MSHKRLLILDSYLFDVWVESSWSPSRECCHGRVMNKEKNSSVAIEFEPPKKRRRIQDNLNQTTSDNDEKVSSNSNVKTTESKQDDETLNNLTKPVKNVLKQYYARLKMMDN